MPMKLAFLELRSFHGRMVMVEKGGKQSTLSHRTWREQDVFRHGTLSATRRGYNLVTLGWRVPVWLSAHAPNIRFLWSTRCGDSSQKTHRTPWREDVGSGLLKRTHAFEKQYRQVSRPMFLSIVSFFL